MMLRIMRNTSVAEALFPKTRQGILAATYGQPERSWYLSELADWLGTTPSSLQRELETLAQSGILRKRKEGDRLYFQAEQDSPVFAPLKELVAQTLGTVAALKGAFAPFAGKIEFAFAYGSAARREESAASDVDVLIVGTIGLAELAPILRELEKRFKREFNASCYKPEEFRQKANKQNHFLTRVLSDEKIFILGSSDDLDRIVKQ